MDSSALPALVLVLVFNDISSLQGFLQFFATSVNGSSSYRNSVPLIRAITASVYSRIKPPSSSYLETHLASRSITIDIENAKLVLFSDAMPASLASVFVSYAQETKPRNRKHPQH